MSTWHIPEVAGLNLTRALKPLCFSFSNDPILTVDSGDCTILVLSDSAAAFDTAHRMILPSRLENCAGSKGAALKWFQSYLTDKSFFFILSTCGIIPPGQLYSSVVFHRVPF